VLIPARRRGEPADGLLVGVAVDSGFAVLETVGYGFVSLLASAGGLIDVGDGCRSGGTQPRQAMPGSASSLVIGLFKAAALLELFHRAVLR
jgi:hypothetical protein